MIVRWVPGHASIADNEVADRGSDGSSRGSDNGRSSSNGSCSDTSIHEELGKGRLCENFLGLLGRGRAETL